MPSAAKPHVKRADMTPKGEDLRPGEVEPCHDHVAVFMLADCRAVAAAYDPFVDQTVTIAETRPKYGSDTSVVRLRELPSLLHETQNDIPALEHKHAFAG